MIRPAQMQSISRIMQTYRKRAPRRLSQDNSVEVPPQCCVVRSYQNTLVLFFEEADFAEESHHTCPAPRDGSTTVGRRAVGRMNLIDDDHHRRPRSSASCPASRNDGYGASRP